MGEEDPLLRVQLPFQDHRFPWPRSESQPVPMVSLSLNHLYGDFSVSAHYKSHIPQWRHLLHYQTLSYGNCVRNSCVSLKREEAIPPISFLGNVRIGIF